MIFMFSGKGLFRDMHLQKQILVLVFDLKGLSRIPSLLDSGFGVLVKISASMGFSVCFVRDP